MNDELGETITVKERERHWELTQTVEDADLALAQAQLNCRRAQICYQRHADSIAKKYFLQGGDRIREDGTIVRQPPVQE